jgi:branched-subunit amino acid ABC-type transport system permease component
MDSFLTFTLLGLVLGAVYAIAASGLVLTYNTSGIFNFAHGGQAMLGAFLYWQLAYGWGWPVWLSVVLVLGVVGPLMGAGLYVVVMRGLRDTAEVTKIVVTVAVMLGMVFLSQWIWHPEEARILPMFFGAQTSVDIGGITIRLHEIICLATAVALAVGLRLLFTRTRLGVTMRAIVDDPDLLQLNGHNPERLAGLAWALGSTLAVLAGLLITPIGGGALEANALTLLVIDAFAAAMFGRLRSISRTFAGAIVLGLVTTYWVAYAPSEWTWAGNFRASMPMVVLFVVLLLLPQDRLRGVAVRTRERYTVPTVSRAAVWAVVLVVSVYLISLLLDDASLSTMTTGFAFAIIALSLTLLTGYAGELNLAPLSFAAIATILAFHFGLHGEGLDQRLGLDGFAIAVLGSAVVGGLVALPALRLRGLYLALATMAFGVFVSNMVLRDINPHVLFGRQFSIFPNGNLIVPPLSVGPLDLRDPRAFLVVVAGVFAVVGVGVVALRNSGYGRRLAAMKDSPAATAMLGQNLVRLKLSVFMLSAGIAGLGGVFMSSAVGSVAVESFTIIGSLSVVMLTVVAGIGYVSGALFGGMTAGVGFTLIVSTLGDLGAAHPGLANVYDTLAQVLVVATGLIGVGVGRNPSGIVHDVVESFRKVRRARPVLYGGLGVVAVLYVLALTDLIGVWWFGVTAFVLVFALPPLASALMPAAVYSVEELRARRRTPPELVGVDEPYTPRLRDRLDRQLGLDGRLVAGQHVPVQRGREIADATP